MQEVELHPAFVWDCEECGRQNFERAILPPFQSVREEYEARQQLALEPGDGFPVLAPVEVTCRVCGEAFSTNVTQIYGDEEEDDEGV